MMKCFWLLDPQIFVYNSNVRSGQRNVWIWVEDYSVSEFKIKWRCSKNNMRSAGGYTDSRFNLAAKKKKKKTDPTCLNH